MTTFHRFPGIRGSLSWDNYFTTYDPDAIFLLNPGNFSIIDCNAKAVQLFQGDLKTDLTGRVSFELYEAPPAEFSKSVFIDTINKGVEHFGPFFICSHAIVQQCRRAVNILVVLQSCNLAVRQSGSQPRQPNQQISKSANK